MENKRWKNGVRIEEVYGSFNNSQQADNILSIYHIHGYLPPFNEPFFERRERNRPFDGRVL